MSSYWSLFPDFDHNEHAPLQEEFARLAEQNNWDGDDDRSKAIRRIQWGRCFRLEFNKHYGEDASSLAGWQALCKEVRLQNIPESVEECKRALKGRVWVNIVDLVDCRRTGQKVKRHKTEEALRRYTKSTEKIFPKREAKENGFLTALLITL
ncbi:hypothetical protein M408DRAFT_330079 [Serendipita vermifera MAFF 305830]|uniref:Uncharacterized protein n=1 Tax=Serendipita vermifera MAFF 305830 TaxID=933852 RepID=A0A0C3B5A9_SERVB|nr:hypothetical protein M408DRAFT_330079 [Serendipita vermifera MAFF 305830]